MTAPSAAARRDDSAPAARAQHDQMANAIRALAMDAVEQAKSGHPGLPMGAADIATVLFTRVLKLDAVDPAWPDRDRFVLSAGHGSMLLYSLLHLLGYEGVTLDQLKRFRQIGSLTPGHPEHGHTPGVETTTGPLGQGLGNAVGMALAERMLPAKPRGADHEATVRLRSGDSARSVLLDPRCRECPDCRGVLHDRRLRGAGSMQRCGGPLLDAGGRTSLAISAPGLAQLFWRLQLCRYRWNQRRHLSCAR
jgi:hypothetical protein